ncbi:Rrf2 family transcriptional regulator [Sphingobium chlorophenolicum]|uniref:Transcriptional regulator family protein n=1 Tax=Sphingobium chlorophenolicum TaxID=46429 RepID=A0A081RFB9_SPHCR|nr:Rrf2 family transcriptional regulator [Sphingobium chlorophenolicum]KEQ53892.1 Transcriptional regulator family protein [Sphingobium chlorophenolicum]
MPASTRFAVAVHALAVLAVGDGQPVRSEDLSYSASTSAVVIRSILARLNDAGLTRSQLGAGGGALLARPAERIQLLDIYLAVEDAEIFPMHRTTPCPTCPVGGSIQQVLKPHFERARQALEQELAGVSLADVAQEVASVGNFEMPLTLPS